MVLVEDSLYIIHTCMWSQHDVAITLGLLGKQIAMQQLLSL